MIAQTQSTLMIRLLTLAFVALSLDAQVRINEVLFYPDPSSQDDFRTHQWLELFNAGTDAVDLTGWSVSASDGVNGARVRALPAVSLPAAAYLVVHFASGTNRLDFSGNSGDYYTGDSTDSPYWSVDADEAALYSPTAIVDFINWARSDVFYVPGQAHQDAVAANIWMAGAVLLHDQIGIERLELLRSIEPGDSLGRDADSTDTDDIADFDALGGQTGHGPTPGRQNLTITPDRALTEPDSGSNTALRKPADAPAKKSWTVLLYISSDNDTESAFEALEVKRIELALQGLDTSKVNFVALWDTLSKTTRRGRLVALPADGTITLSSPDGVIDIGERDLGDPNELSGFIQWAKQNYPADHYGIILSSHGAGWKGFGPDATFPQGTREKKDWLYMGELSAALNGQNLEWIVFHACMMGAVEVAHQLKQAGKYLMVSEEVARAGDFPYVALVNHLVANPGWDGLTSITDIFNEYVNRVKPGGVNAHADYTISVIDLSKVNDLSVNVRAWADLLAPGMSLFFKRDDPTDNAQVVTKNVRDKTETFTDTNYIDLYHFADLMRTSGLPLCLLSPVPSILDILKNRVVILESHGTGHPNAHGLHIYFPARRMINIPLGADGLLTKDAAGLTGAMYFTYVDNVPNPTPPPATVQKIVKRDVYDQPYDLPKTRTFDGTTPLAHYGVNADQLPLKARDPETGSDFDLPGNGLSIVWPLPQSPGFLFPNDTGWRKVLDRFYHPAADNHILPVKLPDGTIVTPTETGGGACANPMDSITVPLGTTVTFSAKGSSDADMPAGIDPLHWFWDRDSKVGCLLGARCIAPFQVGAGTDAATATTNMDADQDIAFTTIDQNDGDGKTFTRVCDVVGSITVTHMPWDDDHLPSFHNTRKTADYVHTQSGKHQAVMNCTSPVTQIPTAGTLQVTFTVVNDQFVSDPFVGLGGQTANVDFTTSMPTGGNSPGAEAAPAATATITLTGDRAALPNGSGTLDTTTGTWNATILAKGNIAGFPNVEVKWVNMQFTGPDKNTISGTYLVGTNGNLNGEPQPITYKVTGTVKRK